MLPGGPHCDPNGRNGNRDPGNGEERCSRAAGRWGEGPNGGEIQEGNGREAKGGAGKGGGADGDTNNRVAHLGRERG